MTNQPLIEIVKNPYNAGREVGRITREMQSNDANVSNLKMRLEAIKRFAFNLYDANQMEMYKRGLWE